MFEQQVVQGGRHGAGGVGGGQARLAAGGLQLRRLVVVGHSAYRSASVTNEQANMAPAH